MASSSSTATPPALDVDRPLEIKSEDIDKTKFTFENLKEMRKLFPGQTDTTFARFLIARSNDLQKAKELLTKHLEWRQKNLPISKKDCIGEFSTGKLYIDGVDKTGHPILVWRGALNVAAERDLEELNKAVMWWMEYAERIMPENRSKITILLDRSDMTSSNSDIEFVKHIASYFQDNFPERMHMAIVHPSGFVFYGIWNIVKWFLDPVTANKVQPIVYFYGVQEYIEDVHIPKSMGGQSPFEFNEANFLDVPAETTTAAAVATSASGGGAP